MHAELGANEAIEAAEQVVNIESVMKQQSGSYPIPAPSSSDLLKPLTQAFVSQPLIGNIILSEEQRTKIRMVAVDALSNALRNTDLQNYGIDDFNCDVLMLETALLLRNWMDCSTDDGGDDDMNFWEYIFNQYALTYDKSFGNSHAYKIFKQVIERSLKRHNRLFVDFGQRYYTTMLIHALAPKVKFYDLFEQIFAFYAKTLNYQYIKADPVFHAFSQAMKSHFENNGSPVHDDVYIKTLQSSSAIKALFSCCPEYMGNFVENVVHSIDVLVAGGKIDESSESSYLDTLLVAWYENRSHEARSRAKHERTMASSDRVITEFSSIRPFYRCDAGKISLVIPPIRLGEESKDPPQITIYRNFGDSKPYSSKLSFYGDYFCITSSKKIVPIDDVLSDYSECIEPHVIISYNKKDIYDSGSKLYRSAIAFGDDGSEINKRPDKERINIFVRAIRHLEGEATSPDCTASLCGNGYLYRALIDDQTHFIIKGIPLFPVEQTVSGLTLNMSIAPVSHCKYLINQQEYFIFSKQPTLTISSEHQTLGKKYRLMIDDILHPLTECCTSINLSCSITLPDEYGAHELRIIENATQLPVHTLHYIVLEGLSLLFAGFYYFHNFISNGSVEITDNYGKNRHKYEIASNSRYMLLPYKDGDLSIDIPTLRWRISGIPVPPDVDQILWHEDIPMSALLELDVPRGFTCTAMMGKKLFKSEKFEIGNEIRARQDPPIQTVDLELQKTNVDPVKIKLFTIAFKPFFKSPPLLMEKDTLRWCAEDNFIGPKDSKFEIRICTGKTEIRCLTAGSTDETIPINKALEDGVYNYRIFKESSGLFGGSEEIVNGEFIVGNPALFRFDNRAVIVTEAMIDNERLQLNWTSGIITGLQYLGDLSLNGESLHYPCYEGMLQYKHEKILRPYATNEYERNGIFREQVNPVKLWIINEYTISLRAPSDDGLYVNKQWSSITDRTPQQGFAEDYCNPDYYAFKIISKMEVYNV